LTGIEENPRPRFRIGDIVTVAGYDGEWEVESRDLTIHYTKGGASTETTYCCVQKDGERESWIIAYPEDMRLIRRANENKTDDSICDETDVLLDEYNDYMTLYNVFGDEEYLAKAKHALQRLKNITTRAG